MLKKTNEVIRRGTDSHPRTWMVSLLKMVFWTVYLVGRAFALIKWFVQLLGD